MADSHASKNVHVALVTGAGSGIGQATAVEFAKAGCHVVVADCNLQGAEETCKIMQDAAPGVESLAVLCDISRPDQAAAMIAATKDKFGRLDYAFNNAGIVGSKAGAVHELPLEVFDAVMSVNLRGHFIAMQSQIPFMLATSPAPAIVLTASVAGHHALPGLGPYVISKHALLGLAKVAAAEYGPRGLRVNSVSPGFIMTPIHEKGAQTGLFEVVQKLTKEGAAISSTTENTGASSTTGSSAHGDVPTTPSKGSAASSKTYAAGAEEGKGAESAGVGSILAAAEHASMQRADAPAQAQAGVVKPVQGTDAAAAAPADTTRLAQAAQADAAMPEDAEKGEALFNIPLRSAGDAKDVAELVVWLCMHGSYITGADVTIDGGMRSIVGV